MDFAPGQTLGDYEILRVLGAGGMGKVYQVRNTLSHRIEAMKVLLPALTSQPDLVDRFLREIRISASLEHPNIASLRTAQHINDQLVMVMEYVEGSTLDWLMHQAPIPIQKAIAYTSQALSALAYAHSKGVIHRDIKPGNIMLTPTGTVKLMDFGIAKLASDSKLTKTGMMVGSVYYMSPEQIEGRDLDARSDVYSLGITLYEIATGRRPFNGDSEYQIMAAHLKGMPQPPREIDASLPAALNDIILMALAKDPAQRFQSADAFRGALASLQQPAPAPRPVQPPAKVEAPKRDHRLLYMVAGSLATIALLAAAVIQVPKYWQASAVSRPAAVAAPVSAQPPAAHAPVPTVAIPTPAAVLVTPAPSPTPEPSTKPEPPPRPTKGVVIVAQAPAGQGQVLPAPAAVPTSTPPPAPQAPVPTATQPSVDPAAISELRDRMMQMSARVGAVNSSLQTLQRAQAQQGVGLRSDMAAAEQRMMNQMNEAEADLRQNNVAGAKKRLDTAERDLEKLETFLGK